MTLEYLRSFKIFEYAIFDLSISFLSIYLLSPIFSKFFLKFKINVPRLNWLFLTLPLSILIHALTGNFTQMTKNFLNPSDHYYLKILIIILVVMGVRGIKRVK